MRRPTKRLLAALLFATASAFSSAAAVGTSAPSARSATKPATEAWLPTAPGPVRPQYATAGVRLGEQFFVFGGLTDLRCPDGSGCGHGPPSVESALYDPQTATWRRTADLPTPLYHASVVAAGTRVYAFGFALTASGERRALFEYDSAADRWSVLPVPPVDTPQLIDAGGRLVAVELDRGDERRRPGAVFDPVRGKWQVLPADTLKRSLTDFAGVWINGRLLLAAEGKPGPRPGNRGHIHIASLDLERMKWSLIGPVGIVADNDPGVGIPGPAGPVVVADRVVWPTGGVYDPATGKTRMIPAGSRAPAGAVPTLSTRSGVPDGVVLGDRVTIRGHAFDPLSGELTALPIPPVSDDVDATYIGATTALFRFGGARLLRVPTNEAYVLWLR